MFLDYKEKLFWKYIYIMQFEIKKRKVHDVIQETSFLF